jgi:hypothetical protein
VVVRGTRPVLVHGLCRTKTGTVLIGISPATLLEVDWKAEELVCALTFSDTLNESICHVDCGVANSLGEDAVQAGHRVAARSPAMSGEM